MRRVLYLDHAPVIGGAEVVLLNLLGAIDAARWRPLVATTAGAAFRPALEAMGIETATVPFGRLKQASLGMPVHLGEAVAAVARLVRRQQVNLLNSNTVRAHIVASLASAVTHVPLVWTVHDNTFPRALVRALAPIPRRVVTVSAWLRAYYRPCGVGRKIQVIHNGLPPARPTESAIGLREELRLPAEARLVVNVGRLVAGKAPHIFVEAAQRVARAMPNVYFVLVGRPDPNEPGQPPLRYTTYLNDVINSSGLSERLIVMGHRQDVDRFYAAADIVVYCALQPEGLPTVLLEAMRWAKPIVASAIGGAAEIIADGHTGRVVPPGDPALLADSLLELLHDPPYAQQLGDNALADQQSRFSLKRQAADTMQVYAALVGDSS